MMALKDLWQTGSNGVSRVNIWNVFFPGFAIAGILLGLQPLSAEEADPILASESRLIISQSLSEDRDRAETKLAPNRQTETILVLPKTSEASDRNLAVVKDANDIPEQIIVKNFDVVGSSVFSKQELNRAVKPYRNRPLTLSELFQARSVITKLYTDKGYVSSGAYIPPQELNDGTVQIAVLEGKLEKINVSGTKHLSEKYISSRIETAAGKPVNVDNLLSALQLLRLDPLIDNISAELSAGISPGTSLLEIEVEEADVFNISTSLDNSRSPSVGSNQRAIGLNHGNLLGLGDRFTFEYANTDGSDAFDFAYALPLNSKNGTIEAAYSRNSNDIVEEPFASVLDIESESRYYELGFRQPIILQPNREFALGLSFTRTESETYFFGDRYQLSRGADINGETNISALRFSQEFVNRNDREVLAFRSQFNVGIDALNPTINSDGEPDSTFLSWRGQSQWVRRLDEDFLLLLRGDAQLATSSLLPLEQFRVGGARSVRGYRQDLSLGDNGLFASAELRIPVLKFKKIDGLVQIAPFFDLGTVWNNDDLEISSSTLPALGVGINFSVGDRLNARLDWGIPLSDVKIENNSLQEDGIYFSINSNFF